MFRVACVAWLAWCHAEWQLLGRRVSPVHGEVARSPSQRQVDIDGKPGSVDVVLEDAAHGGDAVSVRRAQAGPLGALVDGLEHAPFRCVERVEGTLHDDAANVVLVGGRHMCFVMRGAAVRHAVEVLSVETLSTKLPVEMFSTK